MNKRKILAFASGPILSAALSFAALPIIGWYFSPEDVGRNNAFQIVISFSILLFVLGLDQAYVREFHEAKNRSSLFKSCFFPGGVFLFLVLVGTLPLSDGMANLLYGKSESQWYWLTLICIFLSFANRFLSLILRMQERGLAYSLSQVIPKAVFLLVLVGYAFWKIPENYLDLLYANLLSILFATLTLCWNTKKDLRLVISERMNFLEQKGVLKFGAPLIGAGMAYWGLSATSAITLRAFSSFEELGVYSMAMSFAGVAVIFQSIFSTIWMPMVYRWVANQEDLKKIDAVTWMVAICVCLIFSLVGLFSWVIKYILPDGYHKIQFILTCCLAQPLLYTLSEATVVGLNVQRKSMHALGIALVALISNAILSVLLIPSLGATGAAISNAVAYFVFFAARTELSARVWRTVPRGPLYLIIACMMFFSVSTALGGERLIFLMNTVWFFCLCTSIFLLRGALTSFQRSLGRSGI